MPDVFDKKKRSDLMSKVRGKGAHRTEVRLANLFKKYHIKGWRRHYKVYGTPDFVFLNLKLAVFVDGEFWHGHPEKAKIPDTNREFWKKKINRNIERDIEVNERLRAKGWTVVRIWQRELKDERWFLKFCAAVKEAVEKKEKRSK